MKQEKTGRCPICKGKRTPRAQNAAFPFCSHRCQLVDLGHWLDGDYRVPAEPADVYEESGFRGSSES